MVKNTTQPIESISKMTVAESKQLLVGDDNANLRKQVNALITKLKSAVVEAEREAKKLKS